MTRAVHLRSKRSTDTRSSFLQSWGWLLALLQDFLSQEDTSNRDASFEEALGTTEGTARHSSV